MSLQRKLVLLVASSFGVWSACEVDDADLEASGLSSFTIMPAADTVDVMEVDVTGAATLAYRSDDAATIEVFVNGQSAFSSSQDTSDTLELSFSATLPLAAGPNEIVAELRYNGDVLSESFIVTADPAAPDVTFPAWSEAFTQTDTVAVAVASGWTIDEVAFSVDEGEFLPAVDLGDGDFEVALSDLDIGDSALTLRVVTSFGDFSQTHLFHDVVAGIAPVFDCSQSSSMLPTSDLLRDNRTEIRSMTGYFGDPDGGHTVTFVIEFVDELNTQYTNPAAVLTKGRETIDVEFNVGQFGCASNPCNDTYDLSLLVDGQEVCTQTGFGTLFEP